MRLAARASIPKGSGLDGVAAVPQVRSKAVGQKRTETVRSAQNPAHRGTMKYEGGERKKISCAMYGRSPDKTA
jgi:hypothetical protein